MNCTKCHRHLNDCQACNGGRPGHTLLGDSLHCSTCRDSGLVCSQHGGHWK